MLLLKYFNENEKYQVSFEFISEKIVQLVGDFPIKTIGFELSRLPEDVDEKMSKAQAEKFWDGWDYSKYTTVYREIEGGVQFSDDGSVYVEPEFPETFPEPDFEHVETDYTPPLTNQELTEVVADLMYEVSCLQLGL